MTKTYENKLEEQNEQLQKELAEAQEEIENLKESLRRSESANFRQMCENSDKEQSLQQRDNEIERLKQANEAWKKEWENQCEINKELRKNA